MPTLTQIDDQARRILQRRINEGKMSTKLLAFKSKLKPPAISNWKAGKRGLSIEALSRILAALGVELILVRARPEPDPSTPQLKLGL